MLDNAITVVYTDARTVEDIPIQVWKRKAGSEATNQVTQDRNEDKD